MSFTLRAGGEKMAFQGMKEYKFYVGLGLVTLLSSILTMVITQIIKMILVKKKRIYEGMEESKKDQMLAMIGRLVAFFVYTGLYMAKELYVRHTIVLDETLVVGLLTGATGTLVMAKGIYTMLHQWVKKNTVYERLEYVELVKEQLEQEIQQVKEEKNLDFKKESCRTWTLTHQKEKTEEKE